MSHTAGFPNFYGTVSNWLTEVADGMQCTSAIDGVWLWAQLTLPFRAAVFIEGFISQMKWAGFRPSVSRHAGDEKGHIRSASHSLSLVNP